MTSTADVFEHDTNGLREMTVDELDQVGGALAPVVAGFYSRGWRRHRHRGHRSRRLLVVHELMAVHRF
jgi:hypothetical protein